jgi:RNA recognition motif-containing protein
MWRAAAVLYVSLGLPPRSPNFFHEVILMQVFVGNLAYTTTEAELEHKFSTFGKVRSAHLLRDPDGRPRGSAFVDMAEAAAKRALATAYLDWLGRTVYIRESRVAQQSGGGFHRYVEHRKQRVPLANR